MGIRTEVESTVTYPEGIYRSFRSEIHRYYNPIKKTLTDMLSF